jgi:hypothetical protein
MRYMQLTPYLVTPGQGPPNLDGNNVKTFEILFQKHQVGTKERR